MNVILVTAGGIFYMKSSITLQLLLWSLTLSSRIYLAPQSARRGGGYRQRQSRTTHRRVIMGGYKMILS